MSQSYGPTLIENFYMKEYFLHGFFYIGPVALTRFSTGELMVLQFYTRTEINELHGPLTDKTHRHVGRKLNLVISNTHMAFKFTFSDIGPVL